MIAITGGQVVTVAGGSKPGYTILARDGKIEALLPPGEVPEGYPILDAGG